MTFDLASNAIAKLEPYLLMSKSARGAAASKLIQDATAAPGVFVFSELLDMPSIQELSKSDQAPYLSLLQLFAYGTFEDYLREKDQLPPLNQSQLTKLKLLTLVSLSLERRILPYSLLLHTLQISTIRELEDLIIDSVYLDLLRGRLDSQAQQFAVEYAMGRDLAPGKVEQLLSTLQAWSEKTSAVLATLDGQLSSLASQRVAHCTHLDDHERLVNATAEEVLAKQKEGKGRRGGGPGDDLMDVDDPRSMLAGLMGQGEKSKKWKLTSTVNDYAKQSSSRRRKL